MVASKGKFWASFETNFFKMSSTLDAETSLSGKTQCLLAIGGDKKSKLFGVTSSFSFIMPLYKNMIPVL